MKNFEYQLSPFDAIAILDCLDYLNTLQRFSLSISSEVEYSQDEIDAIIQKLTNQHTRQELTQALNSND